MKIFDKSILDKVKEVVCIDDVLVGVMFSEDDVSYVMW